MSVYPVNVGTISVWRGDPWTETVTLVNDDGDPVPLSGFGTSFLGQARRWTDTPVALTLTCTATSNTLTITASAADTAGLAPGRLDFDVQAFTGPTPGPTVVTGNLRIAGDYTRTA